MKITGKRAKIKAIVNRGKAYSVTHYVRIVSRVVGRKFRACDIMRSLRDMSDEGQLYFRINGSKVYGCLTSGSKAFKLI